MSLPRPDMSLRPGRTSGSGTGNSAFEKARAAFAGGSAGGGAAKPAAASSEKPRLVPLWDKPAEHKTPAATSGEKTPVVAAEKKKYDDSSSSSSSEDEKDHKDEQPKHAHPEEPHAPAAAAVVVAEKPADEPAPAVHHHEEPKPVEEKPREAEPAPAVAETAAAPQEAAPAAAGAADDKKPDEHKAAKSKSKSDSSSSDSSWESDDDKPAKAKSPEKPDDKDGDSKAPAKGKGKEKEKGKGKEKGKDKKGKDKKGGSFFGSLSRKKDKNVKKGSGEESEGEGGEDIKGPDSDRSTGDKKPKKTGSLVNVLSAISPRKRDKKKGDKHVLVLAVIGARDLKAANNDGSSDPYCVVTVVGKKSHKTLKTAVMKKTLYPEWNQEFEFPVDQLDQKTTTFRFELFDHNAVQKNVPLGHCEFSVADLGKGKFVDTWVTLQVKDDEDDTEGGKLHIRIAVGHDEEEKLLAIKVQSKPSRIGLPDTGLTEGSSSSSKAAAAADDSSSSESEA